MPPPVYEQNLQDFDENCQECIQENWPQEAPPEDFLLMDIVGGGCSPQSGALIASKSVSVLHPNKPVVAYSSGCLVIVYDLMSDQKVTLVGH